MKKILVLKRLHRRCRQTYTKFRLLVCFRRWTAFLQHICREWESSRLCNMRVQIRAISTWISCLAKLKKFSKDFPEKSIFNLNRIAYNQFKAKRGIFFINVLCENVEMRLEISRQMRNASIVSKRFGLRGIINEWRRKVRRRLKGYVLAEAQQTKIDVMLTRRYLAMFAPFLYARRLLKMGEKYHLKKNMLNAIRTWRAQAKVEVFTRKRRTTSMISRERLLGASMELRLQRAQNFGDYRRRQQATLWLKADAAHAERRFVATFRVFQLLVVTRASRAVRIKLRKFHFKFVLRKFRRYVHFNKQIRAVKRATSRRFFALWSAKFGRRVFARRVVQQMQVGRKINLLTSGFAEWVSDTRVERKFAGHAKQTRLEMLAAALHNMSVWRKINRRKRLVQKNANKLRSRNILGSVYSSLLRRLEVKYRSRDRLRVAHKYYLDQCCRMAFNGLL